VLEFCILGPVEIHTPTSIIRPKGALRRALLLALLVNTRMLVSTDSLINELWGERHPEHAENALHAHISRLRQRIASLDGEKYTRLITHPSGYQLLVESHELDAAIFVRDTERIRQDAELDPPQAVARLRSLLTLWRGPVFGGLTGGYMCQAAAARYEESRLAALDLLYENELRCGNHGPIIPELRGLLARYPFQENFWRQLMIALYRSGRQAEAVDAYREMSHKLMDELGLEPSLDIRLYERAILAQDPLLELPSVHARPSVAFCPPTPDSTACA
jgi:DNA-binding SARP family transcriptional activator